MCLWSFIKIVIGAVGAIIGVVLICIGIGAYHLNEEYLKIIKDADIPKPNIIFIVLGIIILVVSVCGLFQNIRDNEFFKVVVSVILGVIILALIILVIVVYCFRSKFLDRAGGSFDNYWNHRLISSNKEIIEKIQEDLKCCGSAGPSDYVLLPKSCCKELIVDLCLLKNAHEGGCRQTLIDNIDSKIHLYGGISIAAGIIFALIIVTLLY